MSFTKASNELFIAQPTIIKHIKELESDFEVKLFDRIVDKISLTQAGIVLLSYTDHIIALNNEAKFELSQLKGNLCIGANTTIAQYVIPSALGKFNERFNKKGR